MRGMRNVGFNQGNSCSFWVNLRLGFIFRRKLNARIVELEELAEQARLRASKLEKEKNKLIVEIREITVELETVSPLRFIKEYTPQYYQLPAYNKLNMDSSCEEK